MATQRAPPPQFLLAEVLGFVPQLLLDDIINTANSQLQDGIMGLESFLDEWASQDVERRDGEWIEQGLVSFQTLLEYHTDKAFDKFEGWALRNIFAVRDELPLVMVHHENLDLRTQGGEEDELEREMNELLRKMENVRVYFYEEGHASN
jgi:kinetochore protein Mis12/MTW1